MGTRLVTIATFDQPLLARLVKNALDEVGILATVTDEALATADGGASNALGRVKVQVLEQEAERSVAALARHFGNGGKARIAQDEAASATLVWSTIFRHNFCL